MEYLYYVLFPNHENGLRLHQLLRDNQISSRISPTPRKLSKCCGISLMVNEEDIEKIEEIVADNGVDIIGIERLEKDINPNRDKYC